MRKFVSFVFALILCLSMAVTASATTVKSNQGGNPGGKPTAPRTGSVAVAVLSAGPALRAVSAPLPTRRAKSNQSN